MADAGGGIAWNPPPRTATETKASKGLRPMHQFYRSLREWASFLRSETSLRGASRTVRTEVTVDRQVTAVFRTGAGGEGSGACPLCGHQLEPAQRARWITPPEDDAGAPRRD
jgi:hypothetical protein